MSATKSDSAFFLQASQQELLRVKAVRGVHAVLLLVVSRRQEVEIVVVLGKPPAVVQAKSINCDISDSTKRSAKVKEMGKGRRKNL